MRYKHKRLNYVIQKNCIAITLKLENRNYVNTKQKESWCDYTNARESRL